MPVEIIYEIKNGKRILTKIDIYGNKKIALEYKTYDYPVFEYTSYNDQGEIYASYKREFSPDGLTAEWSRGEGYSYLETYDERGFLIKFDQGNWWFTYEYPEIDKEGNWLQQVKIDGDEATLKIREIEYY
jgi:hypothetical protein